MRRFAQHALKLLLTLFWGGFLAATLIRFAPGLGTDEAQLDIRLSNKSIEALRSRPQEGLVVFYLHYCERLLRGDLGVSRTLQRPVRELIAERLPETLKTVGLGLCLAWIISLSLACLIATVRSSALDIAAGILCGALLCLPAAAVAILFVLVRVPARLVLAVIVLPQVYRYSRNLLLRSLDQPYVLAAHAKGMSNLRVFFWHVLRPTVPQLLAVAGVSASLAFTAAIPMEALCDLPGLGQLAWKAALGRDLYLLIVLTILVTALTLIVNSTCELLGDLAGAREA